MQKILCNLTKSQAFNKEKQGSISLLCRIKKEKHNFRCVFLMAERKGFEPLNAFNTLHDFQSCAFDQLSHLSIALRSITAKTIIAK